MEFCLDGTDGGGSVYLGQEFESVAFEFCTAVIAKREELGLSHDAYNR